MRRKKKLNIKNSIEKITKSIEEEKIEEVIKEPVEIINAVSVIIPACDRAENTKKLIDELLYQKINSYPETEIIVIENNSKEDMSFLDDYENIIVRHEIIPGAAHARNKGLDIARGEYIAFIDNDDFISTDYLHQLYQTMRHEKCDWCLFSYKVDGQDIIVETNLENPLEKYLGCPHYCYHRRIIGDKRMNEKLNVAEDIEWMPKIITPDTKGAYILKPIYFVTWEGNNDSLSHRFNRGEIKKERR